MDNKDKLEIISRRAFFRKAISKGLPFLVGIYSTSILNSCKENYELESALASGCNGCRSTCRGEASNSTGCTGSSCTSSCTAYCKNISNNSKKKERKK